MNFIIYVQYITIIFVSSSTAIRKAHFCNETVTNEDLTSHDTGCISSEKCSCYSGYEADNTNKSNCIPRCESNCQKNSSCTSPNICTCDAEYKLNEANKMCEPICKDQVENSRCVKPPNTWICVENYQHDRRIDKCVLEYCLCNSNGYCLNREDECLCYDLYTKNITTGQCEPLCQSVCENSICVANNVCDCLDGYHKTLVDHVCEQNDLCNGHPCKNGECLITGECKCKAGYVKSLSYSGQFQCDVIQTFIGKVMTIILGVPLLLVICVSIIIYALTKKKTYKVKEQEMVLINGI